MKKKKEENGVGLCAVVGISLEKGLPWDSQSVCKRAHFCPSLPFCLLGSVKSFCMATASLCAFLSAFLLHIENWEKAGTGHALTPENSEKVKEEHRGVEMGLPPHSILCVGFIWSVILSRRRRRKKTFEKTLA